MKRKKKILFFRGRKKQPFRQTPWSGEPSSTRTTWSCSTQNVKVKTRARKHGTSVCAHETYPFFSKRWMISPVRLRCTASGLSIMYLFGERKKKRKFTRHQEKRASQSSVSHTHRNDRRTNDNTARESAREAHTHTHIYAAHTTARGQTHVCSSFGFAGAAMCSDCDTRGEKKQTRCGIKN